MIRVQKLKSLSVARLRMAFLTNASFYSALKIQPFNLLAFGRLALSFACLSTCVLSQVALAEGNNNVSITKKPAQIETRTFNPAEPGKDVPLKPGEDATTAWNFGYTVELGCHLNTMKREGESYRASFKISRVTATISMPVTLWLPANVNKRLAEHEDGHRQICEEIYGSAEKTAERQAELMIGQVFSGEAQTLEEARTQAIFKASAELNRLYCRDTLDYSRRVSQQYDKLTHHGKNRLPVLLAVREAFFQDYFNSLVGPKQ